MRSVVRAIALVSAGAAALAAVQTVAYADTGGNRVYFVEGSKPYTAPVARPGNLSRLPVPSVPGARHTYVNKVVPSPDGRHLAEIIQTGGHWHRVFVTDHRGRHAHQAYVVRDPVVAGHSYVWSLDGLSWRGEHRLYFSAQLTDFTADIGSTDTVSSVLAVHISKSGTAGVVKTVPGTSGLVGPAVDPTQKRLAAIRVDSQECTTGTQDTTTSTIVVLDLVTGTQRDLTTLTSRPGHCPAPIVSLAWSPRGAQIAFPLAVSPRFTGLVHNEIDLVAVDGSDGSKPRVAVPDDGKHLVASPTWQSPHHLWFTQQVTRVNHENSKVPPDLYSARIRGGHGVTRQREARTRRFAETSPSFG
jgi:hypothetical protein